MAEEDADVYLYKNITSNYVNSSCRADIRKGESLTFISRRRQNEGCDGPDSDPI